MKDTDTSTPIVTLTTDWGQHDFYCGMLKGRLLTACPNIRIVDLSHDIASFNIHNAAFIVRHSFSSFPLGTIHLIMVNSESSHSSRLLIVENQEHFFVVPDNGILGLLFSSAAKEVFQVSFDPTGGFASLNTYVGIVEKLNGKMPLTKIGEETNSFEERIALRATIDESIITGSIIYIDSYRNAITNISRNLFERIGQNRSFNIFVQSNHNKISKLSSSYNQVDQGELLAIFNSASLLEIAIRDGFASELLSLKVGGIVRINFS